MKGQFIVLEGPDGSGTTTHSKLLADRLRKDGRDVVLTAEPTDGPIGRFIRQQLKSSDGGARHGVPLPASALQLLFTADRAWHVKNVIEPALKKGKTVICDRYILSTLIYGRISGEPLQWLQDLNKNFIQPDCIIVLLPPFPAGIRRIRSRNGKDLFEEEEFQRKIYVAYAEHARDTGNKTIDTSRPLRDTADEIHALCSG